MKNKLIVLVCISFVLSFSFSLLSLFPGVADSNPRYILLKANFHTHTTFSDGALTPSQVVTLYKNQGYDCIAITDHDTTLGFDEAYSAGLQRDLLVIKGEEISCDFPDGTDKHILGLFLNETIVRNASTWRTTEVKVYFDQIHNQGGIGIVAHPWRGNSNNWQVYANEFYIDGWEFYQGWTSSSYVKNWFFHTSNKIFMLNHDFHSGTLPSYYTIMLAENRTIEGVREALDSKRTVLYVGGWYYSTPQNLALLVENQGWDTIRRGV
jgi:hypothetical protein